MSIVLLARELELQALCPVRKNKLAGKWPVFRTEKRKLIAAKTASLCKSYAKGQRDTPRPSSHTSPWAFQRLSVAGRLLRGGIQVVFHARSDVFGLQLFPTSDFPLPERDRASGDELEMPFGLWIMMVLGPADAFVLGIA
jgi:hypothetical protein